MFSKQKISKYILTAAISIGLSQVSSAQTNVHVQENTVIGVEGIMVLGGANIGFYSTAKTDAKGYIIFKPKSTWIGASSSQFVDGYVKVLHNEPFVFPIGANGMYHPIAIDGAANTSAAYFDKKTDKLARSSKNKSVNVSNKSVKVLDQGYWNLEGDQATNITLMWDQSMLVNTLSKEALASLRIVGLRNGVWEEISSSVDEYLFDDSNHLLVSSDQRSTLTKGAISTSREIIPNDYEYFTIGAVKSPTAKVALEVYPNPSSVGQPLNITYELPKEVEAILQIHSASGNLIKSTPLRNYGRVVNVTDIISTSGVYNVSIILSEGNSISEKIVVLEFED